MVEISDGLDVSRIAVERGADHAKLAVRVGQQELRVVLTDAERVRLAELLLGGKVAFSFRSPSPEVGPAVRRDLA
jgi:hypothetical protein